MILVGEWPKELFWKYRIFVCLFHQNERDRIYLITVMPLELYHMSFLTGDKWVYWSLLKINSTTDIIVECVKLYFNNIVKKKW